MTVRLESERKRGGRRASIEVWADELLGAGCRYSNIGGKEKACRRNRLVSAPKVAIEMYLAGVDENERRACQVCSPPSFWYGCYL